jgi:hypothetical protein
MIIHIKRTLWTRHELTGEFPPEWLKKLGEAVEDDNPIAVDALIDDFEEFHEDNWEEFDDMLDTKEALTAQENEDQATIDVYENKQNEESDKKLYSNG